MGAVVPIVAALAPVLGSFASSLFAPKPPSAPKAAPQPTAPAPLKDKESSVDSVLDQDAARTRSLKRRRAKNSESGILASLEDPKEKESKVKKKTLLGE